MSEPVSEAAWKLISELRPNEPISPYHIGLVQLALDAAKAEGAREERERCAKLVCIFCREAWPWALGWHKDANPDVDGGYALECGAFRYGILSAERIKRGEM